MFSVPASTAASAPPWSLYETPVDMLDAKTTIVEFLVGTPLVLSRLDKPEVSLLGV